jgi:hypothetical protein
MSQSLKPLIIFLSILGAGSLASLPAATLVDTFDTDTAGSAPANPSASATFDLISSDGTGSSILVSNAESVSPSNSLDLMTDGIDTNSPDYAYILGAGAYFSTTSESVLSYDFEFDSVSENSSLYLTDAAGVVAEVGFYNGSVYAYDGTAPSVIGTVTSGEFYALTLTTNLASSTYSFTISSLGATPTILSSGSLATQDSGTPTNLLFTSNTISTTAATENLYLDNIAISTPLAPEPSTMGLMGAGALLLMALVRLSRNRKELVG